MSEKPKKLKWWIAELRCRAAKTIVIEAASRKEAQAMLDDGEGTGCDVHYYAVGRARVLRQDKPKTD